MGWIRSNTVSKVNRGAGLSSLKRSEHLSQDPGWFSPQDGVKKKKSLNLTPV